MLQTSTIRMAIQWRIRPYIAHMTKPTIETKIEAKNVARDIDLLHFITSKPLLLQWLSSLPQVDQ